MDAPTQEVRITRYRAAPDTLPDTQKESEELDQLAVERPLEIRLLHWRRQGRGPQQVRSRIAVTMCTPGHDVELATGFLVSEGVLRTPDDLKDTSSGPDWVMLELAPHCTVALDQLERSLPISSSCGVCGRHSIDSIVEQALHCDWNGPGTGPFVSADLILDLPRRLRESQAVFDRTGGLHASGLFSTKGELLCMREDVDRHNALDKVVGHAFLSGRLPLDQTILAVSGRLSFELMQKAAMAGIRIVAAVGAPSSLAVELARELELTIIGFIRDGRMNLYHGEWRVA